MQVFFVWPTFFWFVCPMWQIVLIFIALATAAYLAGYYKDELSEMFNEISEVVTDYVITPFNMIKDVWLNGWQI